MPVTRLLPGLVLVLVLAATQAMAADLKILSQGPTRGGWEYVVRSAVAGRDFRVQVAEPDRLPWDRRRAPAIYLLDGDAYFGRVSRAALDLAQQRRMAKAYVVAVGYPAGTDVQKERLFDLVHVNGQYGNRAIGGRGAAFQGFLVDELRPFIEKRYPIDRRRSVLAGHSVGGLFAATVMATDPQAFGGYLVASPSLQFDMRLIARLGSVEGGGRRVFIAVGGAEDAGMISGAERLAATMGGAGATFEVRQQTFPGANHLGVIGPMLAPGLSFLLPPKGR
jgi:predicted alpha/beta superfamily hydrolase